MKRVPRPFLPVPTTDGRLVRKSQLLEIALVAQTPPKKDRGPTLSLSESRLALKGRASTRAFSHSKVFSHPLSTTLCVCVFDFGMPPPPPPRCRSWLRRTATACSVCVYSADPSLARACLSRFNILLPFPSPCAGPAPKASSRPSHYTLGRRKRNRRRGRNICLHLSALVRGKTRICFHR